MTWMVQTTDLRRRVREILNRATSEKRATWLAELRRIAEEVNARAALSEGEATALIDEVIQATRSGSA